MNISHQSSDSSDDILKQESQRLDWQTVRNFVWDPKEKRFLRRTAESWGYIILYFIGFYSGLIVFTAICMFSFLKLVSEEIPYRQLEESIIGTNPGMGFRPMGHFLENLIEYNAAIDQSVSIWTKRIDNFLETYTNQNNTNQADCDFYSLPSPGQVCNFKLKTLGPSCTHLKTYGYHSRMPCFFVKLNKIFGWRPQPYENISELPSDMPEDLKRNIYKTSSEMRKMIWVSCKGDTDSDKLKMGEVEYWPYQGFPAFYFPYTNAKNYLQPLVAVQLKNPAQNELINIECRAWARNIRHHRENQEREGGVLLQINIH